MRLLRQNRLIPTIAGKPTKRTALPRLRVIRIPGLPDGAKLIAGTQTILCALGPNGITRRKREGDGATPSGVHGLSHVLFRKDRAPRPRTGLPVRPLQPDDGWCDDPRSALYNSLVRLPFAPSHELLWRRDGLYDCIVVIAYNTGIVKRGRGSAIFLHVAAPDLTPTAGCVAIRPDALRRLLQRLDRNTRILIT